MRTDHVRLSVMWIPRYLKWFALSTVVLSILCTSSPVASKNPQSAPWFRRCSVTPRCQIHHLLLLPVDSLILTGDQGHHCVVSKLYHDVGVTSGHRVCTGSTGRGSEHSLPQSQSVGLFVDLLIKVPCSTYQTPWDHTFSSELIFFFFLEIPTGSCFTCLCTWAIKQQLNGA